MKLRLTAFIIAGTLLLAGTAKAQTPPPISGVTGTVATETTRDQERAAAGKVLTKTAESLKKITGRGGTAVSDDPMAGLREGLTVAVRQAPAAGDTAGGAEPVEGSAPVLSNEGRVLGVDRRKRQISLRVNGHVDTYELVEANATPSTDRAAAGDTVTLAWNDEVGTRMSQAFRRLRF